MIYKSFQGLKLSALGMGCMRLPTKGSNAEIDIDYTKEMVAYALQNGINYFDTAYGYHDGQSELIIGEILKEYPRESFYLADKFPGFSEQNVINHKEIFENQLKKCQVDYFDFYLFHCLSDTNVEWYLNPKLGLMDFLKNQKQDGKIRHLGFSAHASFETFSRFLEAYHNDIEFCQLQINWFDFEFQNAKQKVELCRKYNIPIWVMEPVRGGSLVSLAPIYETKFRKLRPDIGNVEWAFRFIQSIPEVAVTLSGMSNFEQLKQNIEIFKTESPLNAEEMETVLALGRAMASEKIIPCTACRYCTPNCPASLDIPKLIELYNENIYSNNKVLTRRSLETIEADKWPAACIGCHACEAVCPQSIKISEMMTDFSEKLK